MFHVSPMKGSDFQAMNIYSDIRFQYKRKMSFVLLQCLIQKYLLQRFNFIKMFVGKLFLNAAIIMTKNCFTPFWHHFILISIGRSCSMKYPKRSTSRITQGINAPYIVAPLIIGLTGIWDSVNHCTRNYCPEPDLKNMYFVSEINDPGRY